MTEDPSFKLDEEIVISEERLSKLKDVSAESEYDDVSFEKNDLLDTKDDVFPAESDWDHTVEKMKRAFLDQGNTDADWIAQPSHDEQILKMMENTYATVREAAGNLWDDLGVKSRRDLFRASLADLPELNPPEVKLPEDSDESIPGVGPIEIDMSELDAEPEPDERPVAEVPGSMSGAQPVGEPITTVETIERPKLSSEERLRTEVRAEYADHLAMMERELMGDPAKDEKMRTAVRKLGEDMLKKRRKANPEASEEELFGFSNWLEKQLSTPATGSEKHVRQMTWPERRMAYLKHVESEKEKESEGEAA